MNHSGKITGSYQGFNFGDIEIVLPAAKTRGDKSLSPYIANLRIYLEQVWMLAQYFSENIQEWIAQWIDIQYLNTLISIFKASSISIDRVAQAKTSRDTFPAQFNESLTVKHGQRGSPIVCIRSSDEGWKILPCRIAFSQTCANEVYAVLKRIMQLTDNSYNPQHITSSDLYKDQVASAVDTTIAPNVWNEEAAPISSQLPVVKIPEMSVSQESDPVATSLPPVVATTQERVIESLLPATLVMKILQSLRSSPSLQAIPGTEHFYLPAPAFDTMLKDGMVFDLDTALVTETRIVAELPAAVIQKQGFFRPVLRFSRDRFLEKKGNGNIKGELASIMEALAWWDSWISKGVEFIPYNVGDLQVVKTLMSSWGDLETHLMSFYRALNIGDTIADRTLSKGYLIKFPLNMKDDSESISIEGARWKIEMYKTALEDTRSEMDWLKTLLIQEEDLKNKLKEQISQLEKELEKPEELRYEVLHRKIQEIFFHGSRINIGTLENMRLMISQFQTALWEMGNDIDNALNFEWSIQSLRIEREGKLWDLQILDGSILQKTNQIEVLTMRIEAIEHALERYKNLLRRKITELQSLLD